MHESTQALIRIDDARLRANVDEYLRSPAGRKVCEVFDTPWWLYVVGTVFGLIFGSILVLTIVWARAGLKTLWSVFSLEWVRKMSQSVRDNPQKVTPFLAHGVVIGPDQVHALVLGTFLPSGKCSPDWLDALATKLATLYEMDIPGDEDQGLWELLRDDTFVHYRRRRVPEPYADGKELYLFDVEVDLDDSLPLPDHPQLFLFVAPPGERGENAQLPWELTEGAFSIG